MAGARESLPVHRIAVQDDTVLLVMAGVGGDGHDSVDTSRQVLEPGGRGWSTTPTFPTPPPTTPTSRKESMNSRRGSISRSWSRKSGRWSKNRSSRTSTRRWNI